MLPRAANRVVGAAARPEAEALGREVRIEDGLQDLKQGLLDQSVQHRRNAQRPYAFPVRLGDLHLPDRLRAIFSAEQFRPYAGPVQPAVVHELLDGHPVDARSATVLHYPLVRREQVLASHHLFDERCRRVPGDSSVCRLRLTRAIRTLGDSVAYPPGAFRHLSLRFCVCCGGRTRRAGSAPVFGPSRPCDGRRYYGLG